MRFLGLRQGRRVDPGRRAVHACFPQQAEPNPMAKRSIIVTGGFGTLGRATAAALVAAGHDVARIDQALFAPSGDSTTLDLAGVDLTDEAACGMAIAAVRDRFDGLDALVNVAGGFLWETLGDGSLDSWHRMFAMNVVTTATMSRAALSLLKASAAGRIVNIGAGAAIHAAAGMGAYAAAKAGVHRLTEALAAELAGTSVTVNAILPSIIDTPTNRADMPDADFGSWVQPAAIADVVMFIVSDASRSISGALIPVSRGTSE
jgi:NAD(P)-dependent dehydrogenase (short-subunit alcohol dehydrogenase family)